jgi:nitrate reductase NapA
MINRRDFLKGSALLSSAAIFPTNLLAKNDRNITQNYLCGFSSELNKIIIKSKLLDNTKTPYTIEGKNLNVKSYHNLSYQNHEDRIKTPLLKMTDGKYDKNGIFTPISWKKAFEIMSQKAKYALKESGTDGVGLATSGNISIDESYALMKLFKGGFRSNNIFNTAHYTSYASMQALVTVFGNDTNNGDLYDINYTDTLIAWGVNFAETYPTLLANILQAQKEKKEYKFINIATIKNRTSNFADLNIYIKPNKDLLLLNFLTRELIYNNENKIDWDTIKQRTIFATLDSSKSNDADRLKQWEISYKEYKESLKQYTLDFVAKEIKTEDEDLELFKSKLQELAKCYTDQTSKTTSIWASGINKQKNAIDTNIALYSLHILLNKHSRPGCSTLSLSGQISSNGSAVEVGAFSNRLPSNRYTKYKEHRIETENIWRIPQGTLNPIASNDQMQFFRNIKSNTTKFIWIAHANPFHSTPDGMKYLKALKNSDTFVVTSDCFHTKTTSLSDLILPSSTHLEKHSIFGSVDRKTAISKQYLIPYENSMSLLWQTCEFSKFFMAKDLWRKIPTSNGEALKSVKQEIRKFGYKYNDTLYRILFGTIRAKSYKLSQQEKYSYNYNTEVKSDKRNIVGSDDTTFYGYQFHIQKYLFEEYRNFGRGRAYDLASYDECSTKPYKWPYLYNKSIYYRFNPINDIYASKVARLQDKYIFYGKMGSKQLPFGNLKGITDENLKELKNRAKIFAVPYKNTYTENMNYKFQLLSIKTIEHWNTGTITMKIKELKNSLPMSYCYMNSDNMKLLSLKNEEIVNIHSPVGMLKTKVISDKRFQLQKGMIAIGNFDERIPINQITKTINNTYVNITKIGDKDI